MRRPPNRRLVLLATAILVAAAAGAALPRAPAAGEPAAQAALFGKPSGGL